MRVVIDTNVFVSGVFWKGPPAEILRAWREGRIEIVLSPEILDEYRRVGEELNRQFPRIDLGDIIDALVLGAHTTLSPPLPEAVCTDPDDDKFIAAALAGGAALVISGDRALLKVKEYAGVRIVTPGAFVRTYLRRA